MLLTTEKEFIKEYKNDLIKFLEKSRETIQSTSEDNRVKKMIENIEYFNSTPNEDDFDSDTYNIYLMEQYS